MIHIKCRQKGTAISDTVDVLIVKNMRNCVHGIVSKRNATP